MIENQRRLHLWLWVGLFQIVGVAAVDAVQSSDGVWRDVDETSLRPSSERRITPERYRLLALSRSDLEAVLERAPDEESLQADEAGAVLELPLPDGGFERFEVVVSPIMDPELARKFPQIRTYRGRGLDDPTATVRFDHTQKGFHAMILSARGSIFIDPYRPGDTTHHISYYKRDRGQRDEGAFRCLVEHDASELRWPSFSGLSSGTQLRTYRTVVAATGEYTAFHSNPSPPNVSDGLAAIVTAMNRVNGIYEREVAIRMTLVADNDQVVYTDSGTDPYTNSSGSAMLGENQTNVDNVIGSANYDIGHVFSTGGGGIASLGVPCNGSFKARGVTGLNSPTGDSFWVDFVSHEMGHQWGGLHTWNGNTGFCDLAGWDQSAAMEPGSGSTIMGYAGICSPQNLQSNSDDYFHGISFDNIVTYSALGGGNSCAAISATGNSPPTVEAGPSYTIPISTPFTICGTAVDPDGDALTHSWEQFNVPPQQTAPNAPVGDAPIFRSFPASSSLCRTFPQASDLLNNTQTLGELLPTYSRVLTLRLTSRDNVAGGGGVGNDSVDITVTDAAGPFLVTAPNTAVSWTGGASENVTWDVANTDTSGVNCNAADVLFSTDGGSTFPVALASGTANDGLHAIAVPNVTTSTARMMVRCSDNVFFDLSNANFNVSAVGGCLEDQILVDRSIAGVQTFEGGTTLSAYEFVVQGTGNVTFQAPTVVLGEGFEVRSGGTFTAEIVAGPCP